MAPPDPKLYEHLTNKERMLAGFPYYPYTEELLADRDLSRQLAKEFHDCDPSDVEGQRKILKKLLHPDSGKNITIKPAFRVDYGFYIKIGDNSFLDADCCILDTVPVTIGKNFWAGPCVHIYGATHPTDPLERRWHEKGVAVTIGDNVKIGGRSVVCPGVTIGNNVIVDTGSVVTKNVPDNCRVAGNPAVIVERWDLTGN